MGSDQSETQPYLSDWFHTSGVYEGRGCAEFLTPKGRATGAAKASFDEEGHCVVKMVVEQVEIDGTPGADALRLILGPGTSADGQSFSLGASNFNPCAKLTVDTDAGTLLSTWHVAYGVRFSLGSDDEVLVLQFDLFKATFAVRGAGHPGYWVLPLLNFVSDFHFRHPLLDSHPLRIFQTPKVPAELSGNDAALATFNANSRNRLVIFEFNAAPGFIEPLADYEDRVRRLEGREAQALITAVMVGKVGSHEIELDDVERWFPFDYLTLLGVATGTVVGAPWIEFRDTQGNLVRRLHVTQGQPAFSEGHWVIREGLNGNGIGHLLTQSLTSSDWKEAFVRVAAKQVVRGGSYRLSVEDMLSHLFRALDALCDGYKLTRWNVKFAGDTQNTLDKTVFDTVRVVRHLADSAERANRVEEASRLRSIARQVGEAKSVKVGFGRAVLALLERFNLPDAEIVEKHYRSHPRRDGKKWSDVLSYYRGITMHHGYFEFAEAKFEIDDVLTIIEHLHDILVRILLRIAGYHGTYRPSMIKMPASEPMDWVTPGLSADRLGYKTPADGA